MTDTVTTVAPTTAIEAALVGADELIDPTTQPLLPYQSAFAEWLVAQPTKPAASVQRKVLSRLWQRPVSSDRFKAEMRRLKANPHWVSYLKALQADALRRSRAILESHYVEGVKTHVEGMRMAVEAKDYKALPSYTVPILDRVAPKKESAPAATQVNVVLTTKQQQALKLDEVPEVTFEVIQPPPSTAQ